MIPRLDGPLMPDEQKIFDEWANPFTIEDAIAIVEKTLRACLEPFGFRIKRHRDHERITMFDCLLDYGPRESRKSIGQCIAVADRDIFHMPEDRPAECKRRGEFYAHNIARQAIALFMKEAK